MNRNTPEEFDAIWEREKHDPASFDRDKKFFQRIVDLVWWADSVIDAGCGVGVVLEKLKCRFKAGIDFSRVAVDTLPEGTEKIVADLRNYEYPGVCDVVICTETLEHFEDDDLRKVLLNLTTMAPRFVFSVPREFPDPFHVRQFGSVDGFSEWVRLVSDDFQVEEIEENGYVYIIAYGKFRNDLPVRQLGAGEPELGTGSTPEAEKGAAG